MTRRELQLTAICLVVGAVCSAPVLNPFQGITAKRTKLLTTYGYLGERGESGNASSTITAEEWVKAITDIQTFAGIPVTGVLDDQTVELLESDRCGVKDTDTSSDESGSGEGIISSFTLQGSKWYKNSLTYKVISYTEDIAREQQRRIFKTAFDMWQAVTTLTLTDVTDNSPEVSDNDVDILISFGRREHGDGYAFDGAGGTLAHAFYPHNNRGLSGDAHFDDDESFSTGTSAGINLDWVAVHEFGHSLGLAHSNVRNSLMYPWYKGYKETIELTEDDVTGIQSLYGKPIIQVTTQQPTTQQPTTPEKPPEEPTTTEQPTTTEKPTTTEQPTTTEKPTTEQPTTTEKPTTTQQPTTPEKPPEEPTTTEQPTTTEKPTTTQQPTTPEKPTTTEKPTTIQQPTTEEPPAPPNKCDLLSYDAFFNGADGKTYAVSGEYYWIIAQPRAGIESGPHKLEEKFPRLQTPVDAVFTKNGKTLFFRGSRYWQYRYDTSIEKFVIEMTARPIREYGLPSVLNDMDAAFVYRNSRIYFFKEELYWRYNEYLRRIDIGYPKNVSRGWRDLTGPVDGAMTWSSDQNSYFFKGESYFRIDKEAHKVDSGYPQNIALKWMKCY